MLRRRSLAKLRHEVEPVDQAVARPLRRRPGRASCGGGRAPTRCSTRSSSCRARRCRRRFSRPRSCRRAIDGYDPADLDALTAAGEVVWVGVEPLGERDGRVALYLADHLPRLLPPTVGRRDDAAARPDATRDRDPRLPARRTARRSSGRCTRRPAAAIPAETVDALWDLVWQGLVTNDTFHALRAFTRAHAPRAARSAGTSAAPFRSRRLAPPSAEGRWTLVPRRAAAARSGDAAPAADAQTRRMGRGDRAAAARAPRRADARGRGGRSDSRRLRRRLSGAEGDGRERTHPPRLFRRRPRRDAVRAARRARSAALAARRAATMPEVVVLAATDPANPYGATLEWPPRRHRRRAGRGPRTDAVGRRDGDPRRRRARRLSRARRSPARDVSAGREPERLGPRERSRAC